MSKRDKLYQIKNKRKNARENKVKKHIVEETIFDKTTSFGKNAAEHDNIFLKKCFIDTGYLKLLSDTNAFDSIILGRTGSGKTALLNKLEENHENCLRINPEDLSLSYLSNSTVISNLEDLDIHLELFYKLLWRHVISTEILKNKYNFQNTRKRVKAFDNLYLKFKSDPNKEKALKYLKTWGEKFWESLQDRTKEVTKTLEGKIESEIGMNNIAKAKSGIGISDSEKETIIEKCHNVVHSIQLKELTGIIKLIEEVLKDNKYDPYYIIIDDLDKEWAEAHTRMKLIRALINEVNEFAHIKNCKIIISMRYDLLSQVLRETKDAGFQPTKYKDLYIKIKWTEKDLFNLIKVRINHVLRNKSLNFYSILPTKVHGLKPINYIIRRTFMRPRDIIDYFNTISEIASGSSKITAGLITRAESSYSRERFEDISVEWISIYPNLPNAALAFLKGKNKEIHLSTIDEYFILEFLDNYEQFPSNCNDDITNIVSTLKDSDINLKCLNELLKIFFTTGVIGLKENSNNSIHWAELDNSIFPEFDKKNKLVIHPALYGALAIKSS